MRLITVKRVSVVQNDFAKKMTRRFFKISYIHHHYLILVPEGRRRRRTSRNIKEKNTVETSAGTNGQAYFKKPYSRNTTTVPPIRSGRTFNIMFGVKATKPITRPGERDTIKPITADQA